MRSVLLFAVFSLISIAVWARPAEARPESGAICAYDMKDYDSPGFGIPYRSGFYIKGRFGCVYRCACPDGSKFKVTHVLEENHFDLAVFSDETGGPRRARWFLCPRSVKEDSWKPYRDELGRIIAYNVEPNYSPFPAEHMSSSPEISKWLSSCQSR